MRNCGICRRKGESFCHACGQWFCIEHFNEKMAPEVREWYKDIPGKGRVVYTERQMYRCNGCGGLICVDCLDVSDPYRLKCSRCQSTVYPERMIVQEDGMGKYIKKFCAICRDPQVIERSCGVCGRSFCGEHYNAYMTTKGEKHTYWAPGMTKPEKYYSRHTYFCPTHGQLCVDCMKRAFLRKPRCTACDSVLEKI